MDYLKEARDFYSAAIKPFKGKPVGCSQSEVDSLEISLGFSLPEAYKQYLLWMGKDYSGVYQGSDCFLKNIQPNGIYLQDLLDENNVDYKLPENYLVFFMHQGYVARWFELPKESENPQTYYYHEAEYEFPVTDLEFSKVLLSDLKSSAQILPKIFPRKTGWLSKLRNILEH